MLSRNTYIDEHAVGYYSTGDRMKYWGKLGAIWGGFWGLLLGSAFFVIPGIGPVLVAGSAVAWIVGVLEGAVVVGGLSAVGAALYSIGIPKDSIVQYETDLKTDKFLLVCAWYSHGSRQGKEYSRNHTSVQRDRPLQRRDSPVIRPVCHPPVTKKQLTNCPAKQHGH
jgi:hypothetical protein